MRKKIVAGNWKMNKNWAEAQQLAAAISEQLHTLAVDQNKEVVLCPPSPFLLTVKKATTHPQIKVGAQNCHQKDSGAFTGEVSAPMLQSLGMDYVILGHSERRAYFAEDNTSLKEKTDNALNNGLKVIFCCGEQLEQREASTHFDLVHRQLSEALFHLTAEQLQAVVIAYEPVWAIGTGKTASPEQAEEMHASIRQLLKEKYGEKTAEEMTILYGGSCKPHNAEAIFGQKNVDGGLIGGAALKVDSFLGIIEHL